MYNDTIKVANKIISDTDLLDIFQKMNDDLIKYQQLARQEIVQNERYASEYQKWTLKNFDGQIKCKFNFYDDTNIMIDNYNSFITIFNSRLHEIKDMWVTYRYSYIIKEGFNIETVSQHINMSIYEDKMDIDVNLRSFDNKMNDVYELIKTKILHAPERYDRIIKKKSSISNKISIAIGLIPSLIICSLLAIIPAVRQIYGMTYVGFPIVSLIFAYLIGSILCSGKLSDLYSTINPKQKYAYYDSNKHTSVYKDDLDDYINKSEVIIGKNVDNLKNRQEIKELENKYSKLIPKELIALLFLSVLMLVIGIFL